MLDVLVAAFSTNLANCLMDPDLSRWRLRYKKGLEQFWELPQATLYKAVDVSSNKIIGVAAWVALAGNELTELAAGNTFFESLQALALLIPDSGATLTPGEKLGARIGGQLQSGKKRWILGKPCQYLAVVGVSPDRQGRGIGENLVQIGMDDANRRQVVCYLESTPEGYPVYRTLGWNKVDEDIAIDLSEYGGKDRGYGLYVMRLMLKLPDAKPSKTAVV